MQKFLIQICIVDSFKYFSNNKRGGYGIIFTIAK